MPHLQSLTLYVLRHGECRHNVEGWIGSHDDSPLTAKGREQARSNGRLLRDLVPSLSSVDFFASSLHRACATMELILESAGIAPTSYRADHRLMEIHAGDHVGIKRSEITPEDDRAHDADPWNYRRRGGESQGDVFERVGRFLGSLKRDAVIVTHAVPVRMIRAHYLGLPPGEAVCYQHPNAGVLRLGAGGEAYFGE